MLIIKAQINAWEVCTKRTKSLLSNAENYKSKPTSLFKTVKYAKHDRTLTIEEYIEQKQIQWFRDMIHFYDKQDAVKNTKENDDSD